ncbi:hypothetical protein ACI7BZ_15100 [Xanthobacter sp. AM11]|uniref:hypothetical protein n=1 Tax=Xanthobacter sp. AM11 TaxID=3380643 RepID=UPI0039BEDAD3
MTRTVPPGAQAPETRSTGRSSAAVRTLDCDVCVVGDDSAGLIIAGDLACRGQKVIVIATGPGPQLPVDGILAPGFALPTADLVARVGEADAQELLILSAQAADRGLRLAAKAGAAVGPRGRLAVARPHAAAALLREHELRQRLAPDSAILVEGEDTACLLGTTAFAVAMGVVPAERIAPEALRVALEAAARAAGVRFLSVEGALAADLKGLRKYISTGTVRVRAYHVVATGAAAFARLGTAAPRVARAPWVGGAFRVPGTRIPYAGLVEEPGPAGHRFHFDEERLSFAAAVASPVLTRVGAARIVRRHARELYPDVGEGLVEAAQGRLLPDTGGMPLVLESERGVWCALASAGDEISHGLLAAGLIVGAIAERDDRIALLQPFAASMPGGGWAGRLARFAGFWHVRLAEKLHSDAGLPALDESAPAPLTAGHPENRGAPAPRRGMAAATHASRHAARAALHAASGWASGIAARAAAVPARRRPRVAAEEDEAPQRR